MQSARLDFVLADLPILESLLAGKREDARRRIGADLPIEWPDAMLIERVFPIQVARLRSDPSVLPFSGRIAVDRKQRIVVGLVNLKGFPDDRGRVEVGYGIVAAMRRRGYAAEAIGTVIAWALAQPGVHEVIAPIERENAASIATAERIGMQREPHDDPRIAFYIMRS